MTNEELRTWRLEHELSQQELADWLRVSREAVARWEIGSRAVPPFLHLALETLERRLTYTVTGVQR